MENSKILKDNEEIIFCFEPEFKLDDKFKEFLIKDIEIISENENENSVIVFISGLYFKGNVIEENFYNYDVNDNQFTNKIVIEKSLLKVRKRIFLKQLIHN